MVANKMTGEKGVLFTAAYVTKFEEMEKALQPKLNIDSKFLFQIAVQLEEKEKQIQIMAPKAEYVPDLFELKEFTRGDYSDNQTLVTPRGRETFRLMLIKDGLVREG
jgi:phage antirepressor YoqD-like protein